MKRKKRNAYKRIISIVLCMATVVAGLPATVYAFRATPLTENVNTTASVVEIGSYEELAAFRDNVNSGESYEGQTVRLTANIDLGGEENPWTPIGNTSANAFKGTFDGDYHVVSGLYIGSGSNVGFFGYVKEGTVENLVVRGKVTGANYVGGIISYLTNGTVINCGNEAEVSGSSAVGGIVGYVAAGAAITACYNKGEVSGSTGYIGGVVGRHFAAIEVKYCYNSELIKGASATGGIVGGQSGRAVTAKNCYNIGNILATGSDIGAIIGRGTVTIENCFYLSASYTQGVGSNTDAEGVTALDTEAAIREAVLSAETGNEYFETAEDVDYPVLKWEKDIDDGEGIGGQFTEKTERSRELAEYIRQAVISTKTHSGINPSDSLLGDESYVSGASSTDTDWMAFAMGRFGYFNEKTGTYSYLYEDGDGYNKYLEALRAYIEQTYEEQEGILHTIKATEWHRAIVTIDALQGNSKNFGTYLGKSIDLIADGTYNSPLRQGPGTQGINGWIWALLAMDTRLYEVPSSAKYDRERFITEILQMQLTDGVKGNKYGGWVLGGYGTGSDVDITAMAIQALAPYYYEDTVYTYVNRNSKETLQKTVRTCIDEALDRLGEMYDEEAGFSSWGTNNAEGVAQVIVALTALGINPTEDERFITADGKTLLDGLLRFRLEDGGFSHILGGAWNGMATDQATYALVAYWRLENGMRALYDMRENWTETDRVLIEEAKAAIDGLAEPKEENYKESLKAVLEKFEKVPEQERRYVYNYSLLATSIESIGGRERLDTDAPYIVEIEVTKEPDKTEYYENEKIDLAGLEVTAVYSDGTERIMTEGEYKYSPEIFALSDTHVEIIYGRFTAQFTVTVKKRMPWKGEGTEENPFKISESEDLLALAELSAEGRSFTDNYFVLTKDIDLSSVENWVPIGTSSAKQFDGILDGKGCMIKNLTSTSGGLFGYVGSHAVIKNVGVSGSIQAGTRSFIGGIAGWSNGADFIDCWNEADISCGGYSGGIVGTVRDGGKSVILRCYNIGTITDTGFQGAIGGIAGHIATTRQDGEVEATIKGCYNAGAILSSSGFHIGGIVGTMQDGNKLLSCYNIGEIAAISDNYSIRTFAGMNINCPPVCGSVTSGSDVENCYYLSATDEETGYAGITAVTAEEMKSEEFIDRLVGNDPEVVFKKDKYGLENEGYPIIGWQSTKSADIVDELLERIEQIGTVTIESEAEIEELLALYNSLGEKAQSFVGNYEVLKEAKETLEQLKEQEEDSNTGNGGSEGTGETDTGTENTGTEGNTGTNTENQGSEETGEIGGTGSETENEGNTGTNSGNQESEETGEIGGTEAPKTGDNANPDFYMAVLCAVLLCMLCMSRKRWNAVK